MSIPPTCSLSDIFEGYLPQGWRILEERPARFGTMKCLTREEIRLEAPAELPTMNVAAVVRATYASPEAAAEDFETAIRVATKVFPRQIPPFVQYGEVNVERSENDVVKITAALYLFAQANVAAAAILFRVEERIYTAYASLQENAHLLAARLGEVLGIEGLA